MNKLGLCVNYKCNNYGSMLQIFATQQVIKKEGWNYEIIRYDKKNILFVLKNIFRLFNTNFLNGKINLIVRKIQFKKYPELYSKNKFREKLFNDYRESYLGPYSPIFKGYKSLVSNVDRYDAVMVGSDQLWLPAGVGSKFYNLLFVPNTIKKIAFATSFGVSNIPRYQLNITKKYLRRIDFLSVREESGKKLVYALTGKNATIALDPTLLLDKNEWDESFPSIKVVNGPYIFAYFLGNSHDHRKQVMDIARKLNMPVVVCPHLDQFVEADLKFGDIQMFEVNPIDFLNLVRNANYICTDSFHGTVFSIIYHKKFLTFYRFTIGEKHSTNTRIDSLLKMLKIDNRAYKNMEESPLQLLTGEIDYFQVDKKLKNLRNQTRFFLKEALK